MLIEGTLLVHQPHMESILVQPINISCMPCCSHNLVCYFTKNNRYPTKSCSQRSDTTCITSIHNEQTKVFPFRFSLTNKVFPCEVSQCSKPNLTKIDISLIVTSVKASLHNFLATTNKEGFIIFTYHRSAQQNRFFQKHKGFPWMQRAQLITNQTHAVYKNTNTHRHAQRIMQ